MGYLCSNVLYDLISRCLDTRYTAMSETARSRAIISLGISCFKCTNRQVSPHSISSSINLQKPAYFHLFNQFEQVHVSLYTILRII